MYEICAKFFTKNQVDTLVNGKRANKWYNKDIASCIGLRSISPKCYKYMYYNICISALSTLRTWAAKIVLEPGILTSVVNLMKHKGIHHSTKIFKLN